MSYTIVHMQKFNASGLRGIQSHIRRDRISKTNPDIDYDKSSENYTFMPRSKEHSLRELVNSIIEKKTDTSKKIRKDAVLVNSFVITSDKEFFEGLPIEKQKEFFYDSAKFFQERYGNLVYADVHLDETTPHMHLGLVPIKDGKLSSKAIFGNKIELQNLQTDFANEVGKKYGLQRGKEKSGATHLSELEFKKKSVEKLAEKEQNLRSQLNNYDFEIDRLLRKKSELERTLRGFSEMCNNLQKFIEQERNKDYFPSISDLEKISPEFKEACDHERHLREQEKIRAEMKNESQDYEMEF